MALSCGFDEHGACGFTVWNDNDDLHWVRFPAQTLTHSQLYNESIDKCTLLNSNLKLVVHDMSHMLITCTGNEKKCTGCG